MDFKGNLNIIFYYSRLDDVFFFDFQNVTVSSRLIQRWLPLSKDTYSIQFQLPCQRPQSNFLLFVGDYTYKHFADRFKDRIQDDFRLSDHYRTVILLV